MSPEPKRPRRGDWIIVLKSDGNLTGAVGQVRHIYRTGAVSAMFEPDAPGTFGLRISPDTGLVHYIVNAGDYEIFRRGE